MLSAVAQALGGSLATHPGGPAAVTPGRSAFRDTPQRRTVDFFRERPVAGPRQAPPRNVILLLSDDHRYDFMGFMERAPEWLETPALDRMAAGGAHLRNAFVTTSLCSPSRASILTGRHAHRHASSTSPVPRGTVFFPALRQRSDYRIAYAGKWHRAPRALTR